MASIWITFSIDATEIKLCNYFDHLFRHLLYCTRMFRVMLLILIMLIQII